MGADGSMDGTISGTVNPQLVCLSSYDQRIYIGGLGVWGECRVGQASEDPWFPWAKEESA